MARGERARGEVAEVRAALNALTAPGGGGPAGRAAARDLFKKIVHYTTVGIDLSSVFMQVRVLCVCGEGWEEEKKREAVAGRQTKKKHARITLPSTLPPSHPGRRRRRPLRR